MAGFKERYKVRWTDGTIRTVTAQSYQGAKREFIRLYDPPKGATIKVWRQGSPEIVRQMRT